jgi:hypothetical protein
MEWNGPLTVELLDGGSPYAHRAAGQDDDTVFEGREERGIEVDEGHPGHDISDTDCRVLLCFNIKKTKASHKSVLSCICDKRTDILSIVQSSVHGPHIGISPFSKVLELLKAKDSDSVVYLSTHV